MAETGLRETILLVLSFLFVVRATRRSTKAQCRPSRILQEDAARTDNLLSRTVAARRVAKRRAGQLVVSPYNTIVYACYPRPDKISKVDRAREWPTFPSPIPPARIISSDGRPLCRE